MDNIATHLAALQVLDHVERLRAHLGGALIADRLVKETAEEMRVKAEAELISTHPDGIKGFGPNEAAQKRNLEVALQGNRRLSTFWAIQMKMSVTKADVEVATKNAESRLRLLENILAAGIMELPAELALGQDVAGDYDEMFAQAEAEEAEAEETQQNEALINHLRDLAARMKARKDSQPVM